MWYYGKNVRYVSSYVNSKLCHAIMKDIPDHTGWLRIAPTSTDGVTNVLAILAEANANGQKVNIDISSNQITGVYKS
ncbi:hypothetical protein GGR27_001119 [Lewinella antarctica]|uniref:Uncharacterized protein n=1 Tax=Neolewinella antarctica TaxID=442734 RepID=A0ABX0X8N8_9BACT|nr:hypothetical protein [Neolewinella antarctica]